jgi:hypothetical protein
MLGVEKIDLTPIPAVASRSVTLIVRATPEIAIEEG